MQLERHLGQEEQERVYLRQFSVENVYPTVAVVPTNYHPETIPNKHITRHLPEWASISLCCGFVRWDSASNASDTNPLTPALW